MDFSDLSVDGDHIVAELCNSAVAGIHCIFIGIIGMRISAAESYPSHAVFVNNHAGVEAPEHGVIGKLAHAVVYERAADRIFPRAQGRIGLEHADIYGAVCKVKIKLGLSESAFLLYNGGSP